MGGLKEFYFIFYLSDKGVNVWFSYFLEANKTQAAPVYLCLCNVFVKQNKQKQEMQIHLPHSPYMEVALIQVRRRSGLLINRGREGSTI